VDGFCGWQMKSGCLLRTLFTSRLAKPFQLEELLRTITAGLIGS
jgi:hypothetical protein